MNFGGKGYGDSPKYICEKLLLDNKYDIIWVCKDDNIELPLKIKKVKKYSILYFYYIATSKFWILNTRTEIYFRKRKKQIYIQTWHGCLALKRIEFDVADKLKKDYIKNAERDSKWTDLMISNSKFCTAMYKRAFKYNGLIYEYGTPRNDIFINNSNISIREKVNKKLGITSEHKILLYAPTFRIDYKNNPYNINFAILKKTLEKKYSNKWKIVIRLHPGIKRPEELIDNYYDYIDGNNYDDIQELISCCDMLITDYSSTMFEAMIARKPVLIYANDVESYMNDRGTYFEFTELPFEIATNNDELLNIILKDNLDKSIKKYDAFYKKVGLNESGNSCDKIKKYIDSNIE